MKNIYKMIEDLEYLLFNEEKSLYNHILLAD